MKIRLTDWRGIHTQFYIGKKSSIARAEMSLLTDDEVLTVFYKDGTYETFDSAPDRINSYLDARYTVYEPSRGIDLFSNSEWMADGNSESRAFCYNNTL